MPPALLERHGIAPEEVAPVNEAFAGGDVKRALAATPESLADRLVVAGTPDEWLEWLTGTYAAAGLDHALVSFADPFTLRAWADTAIDGLPSLGEQVRLFGNRCCPLWLAGARDLGREPDREPARRRSRRVRESRGSMRSEVLAWVAATQVSPAPSPSATARPARTTFCSSRAEVNLTSSWRPGRLPTTVARPSEIWLAR